MDLIADGSLFLAAVAASLYCLVLSRRLRKLTDTDGGLGVAIASLSAEVEGMSRALTEAKQATVAAETAAGHLDRRLDAAGALELRLKAAEAKAAELGCLIARAEAAAEAADAAAAAAVAAAEPAPELEAELEPEPEPEARVPARSARAKATARKVAARQKQAPKAPAPAAPAAVKAAEPKPAEAKAAPAKAPPPKADMGGDLAAAVGLALGAEGDVDREAIAARLIAALTAAPSEARA